MKIRLLSLGAAALIGVFASFNAAQAQSVGLSEKASRAADILSSAQSKGFARVIVQFAPSPVADQLRPGNAAIVSSMKSYVAATQDAIIATHFGNATASASAQTFDRGLRRFEITPGFAINATPAELNALASDPRVLAISPDRLDKPYLNQSVPLIGMPAAYAAGATGAGYAVAVLDTGSQRIHKFLSSKIVGQVCYSSANGGSSLCPNGQATQNGAGASDATTAACINNGVNICTHGSHVAGIAAGFNTALVDGEPVNGVARDAKIVDFQVFTRFNDNTMCNGAPPCVLSSSVDQISALDYIIQNVTVAGSKIASVNMSLGGGDFASACDDNPVKLPIDQLRALGVLTVIASGNDGFTGSVGAPGCISTAVTVGATARDDSVSGFSNISPVVDLLAPGGGTAGPCVNGGTNGNIRSALSGLNDADNAGFACFAGTSMAAPHVAGAIAAMRTACPSATADAIETALKTTGLAVADTRTGGVTTKPRIRVDQAVAALTCSQPTTLVSSVLPSSRSVQVGTVATAFATVINTGANAGNGCTLAAGSTLPGTFSYRTTNSATNAVTGTPNTAVSIAAGAVQSFVFAIAPTGVIAETELPIVASCANSGAAPSVVGLNTLLFSASAAPVPDIIALGATIGNNGILSIAGNTGSAAFAVATNNIGIGAAITASADLGGLTLPLALSMCQTNPATGACTSAIGPSVTTVIGAQETPTFAIFAQASGAVPFDPAKSRVFVRFKDAGNLTRGSTSVAVRTQ